MKNYRRFLLVMLCLDMFIICGCSYSIAKERLDMTVPVEVNNETKACVDADYNEEIVSSNSCDNNTSSLPAMVIPSGEPIGIYVKSQGVMVIDIGEIAGADGNLYSPCVGKIDTGDYILSIEGEMIDDKAELIEIVNKLGRDDIEMAVQKSNPSGDVTIETVTVKPVENKSGDYMLGLWVKDDISGIGTLTYYNQDGFGALGHSINDNDTGEMFAISDGAIYKANLINIVKSGDNTPGRLEGMIDYSSKNMIGRVENNSSYGINGYITSVGEKTLNYGDYVPVASKEEVVKGTAYLLSSVSGESQYYSIDITDINYDEENKNKELQIRITDSRLVELTSGIVQGMSGTPIIQDGKLVGAVTHVLVNDPTKGYGVFVEEMMK